MINELGSYALALALALSLTQIGLGAAGAATHHPALIGVSRGAAVAAFGALTCAFAVLIHAFVVSDFSVANVAATSHTDKPMFYKVAAAWGSHEGSMLLWCLMLAGYGAAMAAFGHALPRRVHGYALATQGGLVSLFLAYTILASNPLARLAAVPVEGASLNPMLQDWALAVHPPFLYAGYVGFSVVFSLAIAGLIEGRIDAAWARWVRPWTLAAWSLLTIGMTLGAFWAYYELGWGGWWFWDPVENASFMPWLIGAALLHSAIVTEKRGALPGWTTFLALAAFTFAMLGAFLVRSGVLTSVHAFAVDPTRGVLLLAIMGLAAGTGFALFAVRAPFLNGGGLFAPASRESAIVVNNIILSTAAATVLVGTLFPLIREALDGEAVSVGPPFFNITFAPLMVLALAILPTGPLLAWKRGDLGRVWRRLWMILAITAIVGFGAFGMLAPRSGLASGGIALGFWLVAGTLIELGQRLMVLRVPPREVLRRLVSLPRGGFGMTLAHLGLGVFVLGVAFETNWRVEAAQTLAINDVSRLGAYELTLLKVSEVEGPNFTAQRGVVRITKGGYEVCTAWPERRYYPASRSATSEVALCPQGLDDLYVVMGERRDDAASGGWLIRAYVNPWIRLIFAGPALMALGGVVSLSDRRLRIGLAQRREAKAPCA
jgi:cytochrome c-type biogenesis protein CcmF